MNENTIDARGLSCPQPVVLTQKAIKDGEINFKVIVDSVVAKENVIRCAKKSNMNSEFSNDGDGIVIKIFK